MRNTVLVALTLMAAPLAAQGPAPRTLTLEQAIALGRERGVSAALARISERIANSRVGQRRAELLPSVTLSGSATRQTLNLDEFGIPIASGITDPFTLWRFQVQGRETLFDASTYARLRSAKDSAIAVGNDARAAGELAGASAGLAYLRVLSAKETVSAREADSAVSADLLAQSRQQVNAGTSAAIDATRSETQFAAVLTQLEVARN
jgi:outer membrane protein TolC